MAILSGSTADPDEMLALNSIRQVYTGAGYDSSYGGSAGTDTQDHELSGVTANVADCSYAIITMTGLGSIIRGGNATQANVELKAQIKETGGAYGDIIAYKNILSISGVTGTVETSSTHESTQTYRLVAPLTSGMKTNGFQIKAFSQSTAGATAQTTSWNNIQTIVETSS